jgi:hypothetical protein
MYDKLIDLLNSKIMPENFCMDLVSSIDSAFDFSDMDIREYKLNNKAFRDIIKLRDKIYLLKKA